MHRALIILLIGCEDPAALELRVLIEERDLADIHVVVERAPATKVLDCTMPLGGEPEGLCPLDDGEGRWTDEAQLSFVLYGSPSTELAIAIDGRRRLANGDLEVVTTTAAMASLPPNPGERALLALPLVDRTAPRLRCVSPKISDTAFTEQGSLVLIAGRQSFAYVALGSEQDQQRGALYRASYSRGEDSCTVEIEHLVELDCRLRARSLVGRGANDMARLVGVCANNPLNATNLLTIAIDGENPIRVDPITVPTSSNRVSQPVLANLVQPDNMPEVPEIAVVWARRMNDVELLVWIPGARTSTNIDLPGVSIDPEPAEILPGPIAMRGGETEPVIIAGYGGTNGIVRWNGALQFTADPDDADLAPSLRAPALAGPNPWVLADVREGEVRFTTIDRSFAFSSVSSPITYADTKRDLSARVAIARIGDEPQAVFTHDGRVQIHPLDGGSPSSFDAWNGRGDNAQHTLLWNVDGVIGSEIITYDTGDDSLYLANSSGLIFDEWSPLITSRTIDSGLTVALAKLGGPLDLDLDVVALAGPYLEVITLGQSSAPPRESAWPMPNHDPAGTAMWAAPSDAR